MVITFAKIVAIICSCINIFAKNIIIKGASLLIAVFLCMFIGFALNEDEKYIEAKK